MLSLQVCSTLSSTHRHLQFLHRRPHPGSVVVPPAGVRSHLRHAPLQHPQGLPGSGGRRVSPSPPAVHRETQSWPASAAYSWSAQMQSAATLAWSAAQRDSLLRRFDM